MLKVECIQVKTVDHVDLTITNIHHKKQSNIGKCNAGQLN